MEKKVAHERRIAIDLQHAVGQDAPLGTGLEYVGVTRISSSGVGRGRDSGEEVCVIDGTFCEDPLGSVEFHEATQPSRTS